MSLHAAAKHLSSQGRGPDTTLVHMSRDEVKSLNDLAMAHGGHLTLNPETGLPEAGFLDKLLPAIIGGGMAFATGGASIPLMGMSLSAPAAIGLGVGGLETLRTGDLKKGLTAGLGAYGGANIVGGLTAGGTNALTNAKVSGYEDKLAAQGLELDTEAYGKAASELALEAQKNALAASPADQLAAGIQNPGMAVNAMGGPMSAITQAGLAFGPALAEKKDVPETPVDSTPASPLEYQYGAVNPTPTPDVPAYGNLGRDFGKQQNYFPNQGYVASTKEKRGFASGGPIEAMSDANAVGANTGYPMADISKGAYATPYQTPISRNVIGGTSDTGVNPMTGEMQFARGGLSDLGDYSDGGRLLRGPGDGVSDSIPAQIGKKQPARLADGEFVIPARIVSELGNGSTEAGARKLYAMMNRVQKARGKTVGKGKVAKNSRADRHLPA
jgi:hypothetical protein